MVKEPKNAAYIDNTNLHKGSEAEGFAIDYVKFRKYLLERHRVQIAYIQRNYPVPSGRGVVV